MRRCSAKGGCGKTERDTLFYDNDKGRYCIACILKIRNYRRSVQSGKIAREDRAQDAILSFVQEIQKNGSSLVYLLDSGQAYKIGFSSEIAARVRAFKTAHANKFPIRVLAVAKGGRELEQRLHRELREFQKVREWFRRKDEIIATFAGLPNSWVFLSPYLSQEDPTQSNDFDSSPRLVRSRESA